MYIDHKNIIEPKTKITGKSLTGSPKRGFDESGDDGSIDKGCADAMKSN
jgi:hypothetical protein